MSLQLKSSSSTGLLSSFGRLSIIGSSRSPVLTHLQQSRLASHSSQGVANGAKQGHGKRLGAKKGDSELVVPGNIIFRQRGSLWHPGENCVMGRDHTISTLVKGYVRYYRDPRRHPTRKYIGVVFEQYEKLPRHPSAPRTRRLGMEARPVGETPTMPNVEDVDVQVQRAVRYGVGRKLRVSQEPDTAIREGYQVRETYRSIGHTAEREGIIRRLVKQHRKDKWARKLLDRFMLEEKPITAGIPSTRS